MQILLKMYPRNGSRVRRVASYYGTLSDRRYSWQLCFAKKSWEKGPQSFLFHRSKSPLWDSFNFFGSKSPKKLQRNENQHQLNFIAYTLTRELTKGWPDFVGNWFANPSLAKGKRFFTAVSYFSSASLRTSSRVIKVSFAKGFFKGHPIQNPEPTNFASIKQPKLSAFTAFIFRRVPYTFLLCWEFFPSSSRNSFIRWRAG